jgi:beta-lactam-binding protein with PASTA domain
MPSLIGLTRNDASDRLDDIGVEYFVDPAGPPLDDTVIGQRPKPGTPLSARHRVVIVVRCQPAPCPSPAKGESIYDPCSCATR